MTSWLKSLFLLIATAVVCLQPARAGAQAIAVEGDHFAVDRADGTGPHPKFLLFISYFDGLHAADLNGDLDYIANTLHFDGIRVMPNWQRRTSAYCDEAGPDTLFDAAGNVRGDTSPPTGPLKTLIDLVEAARTRRLVVDITFTRQTVAGLSVDDSIRAVTRIATILRPYRNVLFDLENEVEIRDFPEPDVIRLRKAIGENPDPAVGDPARILVVSYSAEGIVAYNQRVGTSAVAVHDPRVAAWPDQVPAVVAPLRASGKPIYLQEPQAWNSNLSICGAQEPTGKEADGNAEHFRTAVANARAAGAAAWTFHTRQSFRLDVGGSLRTHIQQNTTEKNLLEGTTTQASLSTIGSTGVWPIDTRLSIDMLGTGDGTVTSSPAGINCGLAATACSATFPVGAVVTLSSSAATGSDFAGWEGCSGTGTCTVTLDTSKTVGVRFTAVQQVFYYDTDAIGSTRLVTDAHGAVVEFHNYTPFGVEVAPPTGFTPRLFAGKQHDSETQFDYFGARYYANRLARLTTVDPDHVTGNVNDSQSWNGYTYARSNPLRFIDPDGRRWFAKGGNAVWVEANSDGTYTSPGEGWVELDPKNYEYGMNKAFVNGVLSLIGEDAAGGKMLSTWMPPAPGLEDTTFSLLSNLQGIGGLIRSAGARILAARAPGFALEVANLSKQAAASLGNQGATASSKAIALQAAEKWVGPGAKLIRDRSTGKIVGKISDDGLRVYRITSINKAVPYVNLIDKTPGAISNLHVRW